MTTIPTTAETLHSVRDAVKTAYATREGSKSVADRDTQHAFGLITADALRALKPYPGLGAVARVKRLVRAEGDLFAAYSVTADADVRDVLSDALDVVQNLREHAEAEVTALSEEPADTGSEEDDTEEE